MAARDPKERVAKARSASRGPAPQGPAAPTKRVLAGDDLAHESGCFGWRLADADADRFERLLFRRRRPARSGDDRTCMAHRLALRCGEPRDVSDDGLRDVGLDELRCALLGVATDLADHHDRVGLGVVLERTEAVDVRRADDRVSANADAGRET